jgi:pimeloyl-ACP methyl ester carboxylesterase
MIPIEHTAKIARVQGAPGYVHYWQIGNANATPILLLHGAWGNAYAQWGPIMEALGDEYRLIAPDLPGYQGSAPLATPSWPGLVAWLAQFHNSFKVGAVVVVGNSIGGLLARCYAAAHPNRVTAAVMVNGGTFPAVPSYAPLVARLPWLPHFVLRRQAQKALTREVLMRHITPAAVTESFLVAAQGNSNGYAHLFHCVARSADDEVLEAYKGRLSVPTALLWGDEDQLAPMSAAAQLQKELGGTSTLIPLAGCRHVPNVEAPDVFAVQLRAFLHSLRRGRG